MDTTFHCEDCGTEIDEATVEEHERQGHTVRGSVRPDRLLSPDPWAVGGEGDVPGDSR
jgi:hypothetical protein